MAYSYTHSPLRLNNIPRFPLLSLSNPNPTSNFRLPSTRFSFQSLRFKGVTAKPNNKFVCQVKSSMGVELEVFEKEELAVSLAKYVADLSNKFTHQRGAFTVCLSGGSLINYLQKLLEPPYVDSIEWAKWHVFWVDERVVPKTHEDSNYKLAFDGFLSKVPIPPGNVYAINDALSAEGAADDYETCVKHLVNTNVIALSSSSGFPKFDLMLLGMGPDGHVASLFPGHPLVQENKKWVTSIKDSPKPPPERITFTFPVINSSAYIALVVTGTGKADAVHSSLRGSQTSDKLPAALVSAEEELKWFLDKEKKRSRRENIVIATKFAAYPWRLTPGQFVNACRASLDRMQIEQIGIGQLHWSTANYAPFQELALWDGLVAMYDKGLVQAVGVSNYGPKQLLKIHDYLKDRGVPLCSAQVQFSLLSMGEDQQEIKSICDSLGIHIIAYSPLGLGMLTGKYSPSKLPSGPRGLLFKQILPGLDPLFSSLRDIANKRRKTMSQVAINWCICKGTIPIPGVKSITQAKENLGALGWRLSSDELLQLEYAAQESPGRMVQNIFQTR